MAHECGRTHRPVYAAGGDNNILREFGKGNNDSVKHGSGKQTNGTLQTWIFRGEPWLNHWNLYAFCKIFVSKKKKKSELCLRLYFLCLCLFFCVYVPSNKMKYRLKSSFAPGNDYEPEHLTIVRRNSRTYVKAERYKSQWYAGVIERNVSIRPVGRAFIASTLPKSPACIYGNKPISQNLDLSVIVLRLICTWRTPKNNVTFTKRASDDSKDFRTVDSFRFRKINVAI